MLGTLFFVTTKKVKDNLSVNRVRRKSLLKREYIRVDLSISRRVVICAKKVQKLSKQVELSKVRTLTGLILEGS